MPGFLIGPVTGFIDRAKGRGIVSSAWLNQFGKGAALAAGGGNISTQLSVAGVGNGADTTEDVLFTASLPGNSFDVDGREINITAFGSTAATSATKTARLYFGATSINVAATTTQTGVWIMNLFMFRKGASVQVGYSQIDTTVSGSLVRTASIISSSSETETAAIVIKVSGQSTAATANLVVCNGLVISGYN